MVYSRAWVPIGRPDITIHIYFDIKGIWINQVEHKISQFADDTQMNNGEKKIIEKSIDAINKFWKVSGLFLNADKT